MENSCDLSDSNKNLQINEPNYPVNLSNCNGQNLQTICENFSDEQQRNVSVKLLKKKQTKTCANQKHRSDYLKRYVYKKGPKYEPCFRHPKCKYILPVVHVCRRPDNPYGSYYVKSVVKSLKIDQSKEIPAAKQSFYTNSVNYCSNLKGKFVKSKNWESIRYKNQLDFKERMKMEKETTLNSYSDKRKVVSKIQPKPSNYNIMPSYQTPLASRKRSPEEPRSIVGMSSNELLQRLSVKCNSLLYKNVQSQNKVASNEIDKSNLATMSVLNLNHSAVTNLVSQSKVNEATVKYYNTGDDGVDDEVQIIDYENKVLTPYQYHTACPVQQLQSQTGIYQVDNITLRQQQQIPERNRSRNVTEQLSNSETGSTVVTQTISETLKSTQHKSYDFSIPFNESNILIKVMSPDEKRQRTLVKRPSTVLKNKMEKKQKLESLKKVPYEVEPKTASDVVQLDSNENQWKWTEYIRNIITKNQNPIAEDTNKEMYVKNSGTLQSAKTIHPVSMPNNFVNNQRYIDDNYITNEKLSLQPGITTTESASVTIPPTTNFYNSTLNEQITQNRVPFNSTSVIKPTVWHPSRYFRPDVLQRNSPYNPDDTIGSTARAHPYPLLSQVSERTGISQNLDYHYNNHSTNYHPNYSMYSNRTIPSDNRFMRPPVLASNDQSYGQGFRQYRNEFERMSQPCVDPYVRNDMHIPLNLNLNYSQSRPTVDPRIYGYLGEPPMHPMWFYQHMSER